jgi:adenosylcobinamide-phosphate guanylyltransferase
MQALINAGGKGSRMGVCGVEKPMQIIGGKPSVQRVVEALCNSRYIDRVLVSVSDNTLETEKFLKALGIETIRTSGESFMDDLHQSFSHMGGDFVLTCPSDIPLISTPMLDAFIGSFDPVKMESFIALVSCRIVQSLGIKPSFVMSRYGENWAVSGISIMDRQKTLDGDYLMESFYQTDSKEFAVNVNTQKDLELARKMFL